ncbi:MAG: GAF domain-containing protein [Ignavibacteriales bacterium]|nr:GAF domain-containing protein [Ignavibacteriales bacterium]
MNHLSKWVALYLAIDSALLIFGLINILSLPRRARVPFDAYTSEQTVIVAHIFDEKPSSDLAEGDEILSWNGKGVVNPEMLEILGDLSTVDQSVDIEFRRAGERRSAEVTLVPFYSTSRFVVVNIFVALVVWCTGLLVLLNRQKVFVATVLHWLMISLATIILMTWGPIEAGTFVAHLKRILFFVSYTFLGALFLFFTTIFPRPKFGSTPIKAAIIFGPALVLSIILSYTYLRAISKLGGEDFFVFQGVFDVFHIVLAGSALGGLINLFHSFKTSERKEDRARIQWVLLGFAVGATPFVFLIVLPQLFRPAGLVPEEYATLFLLAAPLSLAVSLLRYRLFDVELFINRSIVYAMLTVFIVGLYVLSVLLLVSVLGDERVFAEYGFAVVVTLVIALAFNPLRARLQEFVDSTLFPARGNFRKVITRISRDLQRTLSSDQLFHSLTESAHSVMPFNAIAVYKHVPGKLVMQDSRGDPLNETLTLRKEHIALFTSARVFATRQSVDFRRDDVDVSKESFLTRFDCAICVPLLSESGELLGVIAARPSSATSKFNEEEVDLLLTIAMQAAEILDRLSLQEKIILEQEERKKIEELNKLKSYFVSSVSHELRTPLTSIKMFAETLRLLKQKDPRKRREYLEIIEGETERLSRLIENILDFAKIERGVKEYRFADNNIVETVQRSIRAMKYQFSVEGVRFSSKLPSKPVSMHVDADAVQEVVLNLLSNALKYSTGKKKKIALRLTRRNGTVAIEISDNGIGIAESDVEKIFEPFYRARGSNVPHAGGTGLGLALVKHIVDAHHGSISVESKVGKGSIFTVELPIRTNENDSSR